ncbi:hypothetical protein K7X08_013482 [Anisodus acutangulus]|uniref:Uncharacterized protein n=1 Tax=Anisodus acutangulus TaxID=402998 RepID=A0A9Q1R5B0_9SOLA|nr:hypothetical protein K7X08_013482 [Anisodus acutangulus]
MDSTKIWVESVFKETQKSDNIAIDGIEEKISKVSWDDMVEDTGVMDESRGSGCVGAAFKQDVQAEHVATTAQDETELRVVNDIPSTLKNEEIVISNEKSMMICENVSPLNVSVPKKVSPNKRRHDLVSHNMLNLEYVGNGNVQEMGFNDNKGEEDKSENVLQNMENIYNQGGVSPKSVSKG